MMNMATIINELVKCVAIAVNVFERMGVAVGFTPHEARMFLVIFIAVSAGVRAGIRGAHAAERARERERLINERVNDAIDRKL